MYVERKWEGHPGSLSWWLPVQMDEEDRVKKKVDVPDKEIWNNQMYWIRVFDELVYDTDPNLTNILIGTDWKLYITRNQSVRTPRETHAPNKRGVCWNGVISGSSRSNTLARNPMRWKTLNQGLSTLSRASIRNTPTRDGMNGKLTSYQS